MSLKDHRFLLGYGPDDDRLHRFYIPALSKSIQYDRSTGYFSSHSLAIAAQGIVHLIKNSGKMRLLVGANLQKDDIQAIEEGHTIQEKVEERLLYLLEKPVIEVVKKRLEAIAWMIAERSLAIKVVLPKGPNGIILAPYNSDYYHPKEGVFTDKNGDQVAFSGSINETAQGWEHNYEQFSVYFSWGEGASYLTMTQERFNRLWEGQEKNWVAFPIPEAVKLKLLQYRPDCAPLHDPLEILEKVKKNEIYDERREKILLQFIKDVPHLIGKTCKGIETSTVTPWPHQKEVVKKAIELFPQRFLLCDEVGLGKTIEAGLIIKELLFTHKIKRVLILVPKAVSRQWQEELYEKFLLQFLLYNGKTFTDLNGKQMEAITENPWDSYFLIISSSHLAKRKDRQLQLTSSKSWDMVIVDEAHHARRKDFLDDRYRPNRLLELLHKMKIRTNGLLLLTATPMQINPLEVWDLLMVLDIEGLWGVSQDYFLRFFHQLALSNQEINWHFMLDMMKDYLDRGGAIEDSFAVKAKERLGLVEWEQLKRLPHSNKRDTIIRQVSEDALDILKSMCRLHTPLKQYSFRSTRSLLHKYREVGLLKAKVPHRAPELIWIEMDDKEEELYKRIEDYITNFYNKYEEKRKGLGFIMTVYRRRLTSSFYAMEKSLERRLSFLEGRTDNQGLADEDIESEDLELDVSELLEEEEASFFEEEIQYVKDFLIDLTNLQNESKLENLFSDLDSILRHRDKLLLFTQYTDTMDFLRDKLKIVYGAQVACYSGRGGEIWDHCAWKQTTKEQIKQAFLEGQDLKILICTEAASEGLNLQTCGVIINYDMPWNPMKVEQRIGRIDRIGQIYDEIWIKNYFYDDTVEAEVYRRLGDRIFWFESIVGELQPILIKVSNSIKNIAMTSRSKKEESLEREVDYLNQELDFAKKNQLNIDEDFNQPLPQEDHDPVVITLSQIEEIVISSKSFRNLFFPHPKIKGAHLFDKGDELAEVTFKPQIFDAYPNTLNLLTYGEPLLEELLSRIPDLEEKEISPHIIRLKTEGPSIGYYFLERGVPVPLNTMEELLTIVKLKDDETIWSLDAIKRTEDAFYKAIEEQTQEKDKNKHQRNMNKYSTLKSKAKHLLIKASLIKDRLEEKSCIEDEEDFNLRLKRGYKLLLREKYPFTSLMALLDINPLKNTLNIGDSYHKISEHELMKQFSIIKQNAVYLLSEVSKIKDLL